MFFLRSTLLLVIATAFAPTAEAQLFRFRRPVQQPQQAPANYNAATYQYRQVQAPVTNVPSQRYAQQQAPQCSQRVVYVPVQQQTGQSMRLAQRRAAGNANQRAASQTGQATQQIVMLNVRDPYTGRIVRRPYMITRSTQSATQTNQPEAGTLTSGQQPALSSNGDSTTSPQTVLATKIPSGIDAPTPGQSSSPEAVATTSFESPADDSSQGNYSILEKRSESAEADLPQLDLDEPVLAAPEATETSTPLLKPASTLPTNTDVEATPILNLPKSNVDAGEPGGLELDAGDFDLDLPPLGSDGT